MKDMAARHPLLQLLQNKYSRFMVVYTRIIVVKIKTLKLINSWIILFQLALILFQLVDKAYFLVFF